MTFLGWAALAIMIVGLVWGSIDIGRDARFHRSSIRAQRQREMRHRATRGVALTWHHRE